MWQTWQMPTQVIRLFLKWPVNHHSTKLVCVSPVWYCQMPKYDYPSASPSHSGLACAWMHRQPAWHTSPLDGSLGWSSVCQPLLRATLLLLPWPAAVHSGWRSPRRGLGSLELAFHPGGGTLLGLSPRQSLWWLVGLWWWNHDNRGWTSMLIIVRFWYWFLYNKCWGYTPHHHIVLSFKY